ncbi:MBL fold metallo-hydrolase [Actinocrispum wychmicini]|uniref:Glyoxylase-like metal-dependent hydrolase (Beta-lactamase superfamily II) n=1 Tax=Actinocrispum wychmicini TaxID=1213861 RepID=A0A4R2IRA0_9PSEU|nr:MBL fold metallo-hydrolase [Actinocrispum wychmicini]TCO46538.1 glyoxylase-like metal-dependent hydrolase (beta-lactamase superfamily II) [Actinocrispum wychmicini]
MSTVPAEPSAPGQWEAWKRKELPPVERVRAGLWSVPVPIPHNPLRYTISYISVADDGLLVVDPGWFSDVTWEALTAGLGVIGASVSDVVGVVVTHMHADHHGLSGRIREESGAWVAMHPAEADQLPVRFFRTLPETADKDWLRASGVPDDVAEQMTFSLAAMKPFMDMVEPDILLADGDLVPHGDRTLRAVWTPGHTPGHLCLHDEATDVLLTGDHVLPRISPNIGLALVDEDPLSNYIASLKRIAEFDTAEVLPAHEYRFRGIAARTVALVQHHRERCDEITAVLTEAGAATAWEVTERLTWSRGWAKVKGLMRRSALAETCAHLQYMRKNGTVDLIDGDVQRWQPAQ